MDIRPGLLLTAVLMTATVGAVRGAESDDVRVLGLSWSLSCATAPAAAPLLAVDESLSDWMEETLAPSVDIGVHLLQQLRDYEARRADRSESRLEQARQALLAQFQWNRGDALGAIAAYLDEAPQSGTALLAVEGLGRMRPDPAITRLLLTFITTRKDAEGKRVAGDALVAVADPAAVLTVLNFLAETDRRNVGVVRHTLVRLARATRAEDMLVYHLTSWRRSHDQERRWLSLYVLRGLGTPNAVGNIVKYLDDVDYNLRRTAAQYLAELRVGWDVQAQMVGRLLNIGNPQRQPSDYADLCRALGKLRSGGAIPSLIETLSHRDRIVARAALESLREISDRKIGLDAQKWQQWYDRQLRHEQQTLQQWNAVLAPEEGASRPGDLDVLRACSQLKGFVVFRDEAGELLVPYLDASAAAVQMQVAKALARLGHSGAVPGLIRMLQAGGGRAKTAQDALESISRQRLQSIDQWQQWARSQGL